MVKPYFESNFPEDVKEWIISNWCSDANLSCFRESHTWVNNSSQKN